MLFFLSLIPFFIAWMGENHLAQNTVAAYGLFLMMCAISFNIIQKIALENEGPDSRLAEVMKNTTKEKVSTFSYVAAIVIVISFFLSYNFFNFILYGCDDLVDPGQTHGKIN